MSAHRFKFARQLLGLSALALAMLSTTVAHAQIVTETPEVIYSGNDAQLLRDKASQLGTTVAIYEYVHNTVEYSPYHGSRSGSVNTFLGQRGSDVDIATALIAMLRGQNIPARYAVGTVRIPAAQLTNWLGIGNLDVAVQVLKDQGIQGVTLAADRSTVDFEHAWAEAFVPFDQYRGINTVSPAIDCSQSTNFPRCTWVALDASFKQKTYNGLNLDPYNTVSFDYTAYYNAIKNNDAARRDKNPLSILEDQIGGWLRTNYAGKTLEDVEDTGKIVELREGLLPASLPYQVVGTTRRYDTVAAHDAAVPGTEPKKWDKVVTVTMEVCNPDSGVSISMGTATLSLVEVVTKKLTSVLNSSQSGQVVEQVFRRGAEKIGGGYIDVSGGGSITFGCPEGSKQPQIGMPYWISVEMDGAPSVTSGVSDRKISATYSAIIGGYYLIATGGESSNWSQVHRAADQLLAANDQYKIVFNPSEAGCLADGTNCTPYVDANANGWDASDTKLLENKPALDALTGGLLYVSASQYYAKLREQFERSDRLMKTKTPVIGFLGVVSSVYEAEYIDGTAFSILPGGLLIDMKGLSVGGSYDPEFISGYTIPMPEIAEGAGDIVAPLLGRGSKAIVGELLYEHFSLKLHRSRRMAIFTATNIDGTAYLAIDRDTGLPSANKEEGGERWFEDPRIDSRYFINQDFYSAWSNYFDRGHLTRRTDPTWGDEKEAVRANADTFHFTNCTPQHFRFNQSTKYWQGVERYVLEKGALGHQKKLCVFQGPVLNDEYADADQIQVPLKFWKIVVWEGKEGLKAAGFLVSQEKLLDEPRRQVGRPNDQTVIDVDQFRAPIVGIEKLTQLDFGDLRDHDTYKKPGAIGAEAMKPINCWEDLL